MAFYSPDPGMGQQLERLVAALEGQGRPGLARQLSITWLRYAESPLSSAVPALGSEERQPILLPRGASWGGDRLRYPASVVKLFYLAAVEAWLQRQLLLDGAELRRALADMVQASGNEATSLVVDLLSGTTSGPSLPPERFASWVRQRQLVNAWLQQLAWPELGGCNVCQKTWQEGPYGREHDFYGLAGQDNRNRLSTDATARLLHGVICDELVSPPASRRMKELLQRSLDPALRAADPGNQVDGFLGAGLPPDRARLWSKAGWMSQARHDAAYVEIEGGSPFLLVVFSEGERCARDETLLPELGRQVAEACGGG